MRNPSLTDTRQQFQTYRGHLSNLDRCNRCGAPRSVHGPDWDCPTRPARAHGGVAASLSLGFLLALTSLIAAMTGGADHTRAQATATATAVLIGVTLMVAGTIVARRTR